MAVTPVKISELPAGSALASANELPAVQSGTTNKVTAAQIAAYAQTMPVATVAAAGTDQAGATLIATGWSNVTSGSGGVRLPSIAGGETFFVYNGLATNLNIYPASGQQISGRTANSVITLYGNQYVLIIGRASGQSAVLFGSNQNVALQTLIGQNGAAVAYIDASNGVNLLIDMGVRPASVFFGTPSGQRAIMDSPANGQFRFKSILTGDGDFRNILTLTGVLDAVNYLNVTPAVTTGTPALTAAGSDTNIDLGLTPKGTGNVRFGTHSAIAAETVTGYITIKDSAGNTRKLAVVS